MKTLKKGALMAKKHIEWIEKWLFSGVGDFLALVLVSLTLFVFFFFIECLMLLRHMYLKCYLAC